VTDYAACRDALERAEADLEPAEFHGTVCAMLCCGREGDIDDWLDDIVVTEVGLGAHGTVLVQAGERSRRALLGDDLDLQLLLPDDDTPITERGEALAGWCTGFLFGMGLAGKRTHERLSADAQEVMSDIMTFSRLDSAIDDDDESEAAFAELVEYVRIGVQLIHEELAHGTVAGTPSNRVH
jgi:uncharacterized protein YgfB (UPF0149 family)